MAKRTAAGTLALAVCLGGGALALAGAANADSSSSFSFNTPIAGANRYQTAIDAAETAFPHGAKAAVVVNASSAHEVDGLTASYIAGLAGAPVLYTDATSTPDATQAELQKLGVTNIYIVGGTAVVSQSQQDFWTGAGVNVKRYAGDTRYGTAAAVAEAYKDFGATKPANAFVASGDQGHGADALALGPLAYKLHAPILLTSANSTDSATTTELSNLGANAPIVVGGTTVISDSVYASLHASLRLAGQDRGETAGKIADWAIANAGFSTSSFALVGHQSANDADALVAAPVAGINSVPVLFAGLTSTDTYIASHAGKYTSKGYIFGGPNAVTSDQANDAIKAANSVVGSAVIVTGTNGATFSYTDVTAKKSVSVTVKSTDNFTVDGSSATYNAFLANLTTGDQVSITAPATSGGAATYALTNESLTSGLVGGVHAHTVDIIDPVTGTVLTSPVWDTTSGTNVLWTLDGQSVSQATFAQSLSIGDSISVTGTGADSTHLKTVALTSGSIVGAATGGVTGTSTISLGVLTSAGATLTASEGTSDVYTVDGAAATATTFNNAASSGDQVTYSYSAGVGHWALINAAPASVSGVASSASSSTAVSWNAADGSIKSYTYPVSPATAPTFVVNGSVGTQADFVAAALPGSWITYQAADSATSTTAKLTVTSKPLTGSVYVDPSVTYAGKFDVRDSNGDTVASALDVTTANGTYNTTGALNSDTGAQLYTIDGASATSAQFAARIQKIQLGALQGNITVTAASGVTTYALSTSVYSAAPAITGLTLANSGTHLVVTLNKPVTNSAAAATDWTVKINGSSVTPSAISTVSGSDKITLTVSGSSSSAAGQAIVVAPASATLAAGYLDTYGTALGTSSFTGATS